LNILYEPKFINSFNSIWSFIALDSKTRADIFKRELRQKIEELPFMPYKFRKSLYFDDENIRDLIFKGYVIPYEIDKSKNIILIIGISKYQDKI